MLISIYLIEKYKKGLINLNVISRFLNNIETIKKATEEIENMRAIITLTSLSPQMIEEHTKWQERFYKIVRETQIAQDYNLKIFAALCVGFCDYNPQILLDFPHKSWDATFNNSTEVARRIRNSSARYHGRTLRGEEYLVDAIVDWIDFFGAGGPTQKLNELLETHQDKTKVYDSIVFLVSRPFERAPHRPAAAASHLFDMALAMEWVIPSERYQSLSEPVRRALKFLDPSLPKSNDEKCLLKIREYSRELRWNPRWTDFSLYVLGRNLKIL